MVIPLTNRTFVELKTRDDIFFFYKSHNKTAMCSIQIWLSSSAATPKVSEFTL